MRTISSSNINGDHKIVPPKAGSPSVPSLSRLSKSQLLTRDVFGRTILHVSVLTNDVESMSQLLRSLDIKSILQATDYESGWNILHYICFYKRLACFKVLMSYLENVQTTSPTLLLDLLKRKDRSKIAPLSLLQNDHKDLYWIPRYINEHNEFHLEKRFKHVDSSVSSNEGQPPPIPRVREHDWWFDDRGASDVYVFGSNSNNNLGVGDSSDRAVPTRIQGIPNHADSNIDELDLAAIVTRTRFKQLEVSKYHSVLCTLDGDVYTSGIGSRGRLGHGNNQNAFRFKKVSYFDQELNVIEVSASHSHTLALTASDKIFSWGQNTFNQLGFTSTNTASFKNKLTDVYENEPHEVTSTELRKRDSKINGLRSSKIHSLAYTSTSIYFWGLNIGQMGISPGDHSVEHRVNGVLYKGSVFTQPRELAFHDEIKFVTTCETCTCVVTVSNDIFVLYSNQKVKLPKVPPRIDSASYFDHFKPSILTGAQKIKKIAMKSHNNIHVLLEIGDVVGFSITGNDAKALRSVKYNYVWSATEPDMRVVDIDNSYDGSIILCTKNGSVLVKANAPNAITSKSSHLPSPSSTKKFSKIHHLNRILRVSCDDGFLSFGVLRDDIDSLPFKLQQNDFVKDMEYLSPLVEADMYRKQDQLLDYDHDLNCYITDYLYPRNLESDNTEDHFFTLGYGARSKSSKISNTSRVGNDLLLRSVSEKYDTEANKAPKESSIYQDVASVDNDFFCKILAGSLTPEILEPNLIWQRQKFCDGSIKFKYSEITFGFHTKAFVARSKFCASIFSPKLEGEYFEHRGIKGHYDQQTKTIWFESNASPASVLALVHFMYTNTILPFWDVLNSPEGGQVSEDAQKLKTNFFDLIGLFGMDNSCEQIHVYLSQTRTLAEDTEHGDVIMKLADDETIHCSSMIVSRSAFFETILSGRWDSVPDMVDDMSEVLEPKFVELEGVSPLQMQIILKHLYGCNDLDVFEDAKEVVAESHDSDDFVNFLLELIAVADELLLVQLKHLCELAIKEFISIENVLVLLAHADWLGAEKLFMSCCWYLYNNLDVILFDNNLRNLDESLLRKIELQLGFLTDCKSTDLSVVGKVSNEGSFEASCYTFATNLIEFNEVYMSDSKGFSSFKPLIDIKPDATTNTEESKRRSSSRKFSRKGSNDVSAELRKMSISHKENGRKVSESAIADDDEFEVVGTRRRKSRVSIREDQTPPITPKAEVSQGLLPQNTRKLSNSFAVNDQWSEASSRRKSSSSGSAPSTKLPGVYTPVLGEATEESRKQSRIKFPVASKKSQKERKKLVQGDQSGAYVQHHTGSTESFVDLRNPWKVSNDKDDDSGKLESLPVLGQAPSAAPKMSTVMLQETVSQLEKSEAETQTLEDIQREQEFERWWQEESKRVQQEADMASGQQSRGQARSRGRGSRAKRGRGRGQP